MSDVATKTDIKRARKLLKKLSKDTDDRIQQFHLALAEEALEGIELNYHYLRLNKRARKQAEELCQADVTRAAIWEYVLRLLEDDLRKRGG